MTLLGLLLLLVVLVIVIVAIARGDDPTRIDLEMFTVRTTFLGVFVAGALTLLIGVLGVMVLLAGMRRSRRRRSELKELRHRVDDAPTPAAPATAREHGADTDAGQRRSPPPVTGSPPPPYASGPDRGDADDSFDSAPRER